MTLVGTDIDGTILPPSGVFSDRTKAALASLSEAGIPLVLATARPPRWIDAVAAQLGIKGEAVCANGAVFYDLGARAVIDHIGIDANTLIEVAGLLRDAIPGISLGVETIHGLSVEPGFPLHRQDTAPREVAPFDELEGVHDLTGVKMLGLNIGDTPDAMLAAARDAVGSLLEASTSSRTDPLVELAPAGISKATGLAALAAKHGVDAADAVVFGDALNDLPMFAWAGTSYAVANAHPDVLAAATDVTASVADDGVARIVEALVAARLTESAL